MSLAERDAPTGEKERETPGSRVLTVPAPEPCGWHPTGAWRFLRLTHEEER